ncbi:MAG TPA: hypothetical protein EYG73_11430 [Arcobacter sp.]|nr:hypothetical protein [Arcobacter sp.]
MEYLQFSSLTEKDFDEIIVDAGGRRYTDDLKIQELNCDYILEDVVIELKIIEEEPLGKKEKQQKFIELFPANADTVILYPSEEQKYKYFKILESPIQKALKKASKQLQESAKNINAKLRIAIIMNNGLYMVSKDEFREMAIKRAKNDTSGIDILIVCSMYYYSDKFDMRIFFDFYDIEINNIEYKNKKLIIDKLRLAWNSKTEKYMTEQMSNMNLSRSKEPIQDLFFESNGIRYVKPPIQWGKSSGFWKDGRPREDSRQKETIPDIIVLPVFDEVSYHYAKKYIIQKELLQNSLKDYFKWIEDNPIKSESKFKVVVYIALTKEDLHNNKHPFSINDIQKCANLRYETLFKKIQTSMIEYSDKIDKGNFILLETQEIGINQANDIAYISHIEDDKKQNWIIEGKHIKYEHAVALAIALCLIIKAERVYYIRNEDFKWS